jgi:dimethylhistidine N-methyltransferase
VTEERTRTRPREVPVTRLPDPLSREKMRNEILDGLRTPPRSIPCKYLYDERGSRLFARICELEEYYPTRTEIGILREHVDEMADLLGPDTLLVEYGTGEGLKTRLLLDALEEPAAYVPIDISKEALAEAAAGLRERFPELEVLPVCADYTADYPLPRPSRPPRRRAVFFPGSTPGNFSPDDAGEFLRHVADVVGPGGGVLLGLDRKKDPEILVRAYDDAEGTTAEFNLNLLRRLNRELGADFDLDRWSHRARWNEPASRVEMHLVSEVEQKVRLAETEIPFVAGETIHTENSHKFDRESIAGLADDTGLRVERDWTDPEDYFGVFYLVA